MIEIREARLEDIPDVLAIYNQVMATSTAIYRDEPATLDAHVEWFRARTAQGFPALVATDAIGVRLGFVQVATSARWASSLAGGST